jgi:hypothetical protein
MEYKKLFEQVRCSIQEQCKVLIVKHWEQLFTMWLSSEASFDIGTIYKKALKKQFDYYMNSRLEQQIWMAGTNLVVALHTFLEVHDGVLELDDMLRFTRLYIDRQLVSFDTWCSELRETLDGIYGKQRS